MRHEDVFHFVEINATKHRENNHVLFRMSRWVRRKSLVKIVTLCFRRHPQDTFFLVERKKAKKKKAFKKNLKTI